VLLVRARIIESSSRIVGTDIARKNKLKIGAKVVDILLRIIKMSASTEGKAHCI
jgi:hypothetical protein